MKVDVTVTTDPPRSMRARQLESAFDVPAAQRQTLTWQGDLPIEDQPWHVGLIVGPSGSGKTQCARALWGKEPDLEWSADAVVDDFTGERTLEDIIAVCSAVGFNTIPAWLRPFAVLSNGEQFRATLARKMIETPPDETIVVDEFTSLVDRQVAQIGAFAVAKWVRKNERRFVGVTCHYDVVDWLQPDWTFEPATMTFEWRSVQPRPRIECEIAHVPYATWKLFAPYHYLTADLNTGARCYGLWANGRLAAFGGVLHRPHAQNLRIKGLSRLVTLPDWQGLGLAFVLTDALGSAYKARGYSYHNYPAHPSFIRAFDRSPNWELRKRPKVQSTRIGGKSKYGRTPKGVVVPSRQGPEFSRMWKFDSRANAMFRYVGPAMEDAALAACLTGC